MKIINLILSLGSTIGGFAAICMAKSDMDIAVGGLFLMGGIALFIAYLYEEQKEEVEKLRQIIIKHAENL
jgi:hypothetical protein